MRLTVVGCSGSYPGPRGPASCYLLEADGVDPADPAAGPRPWRVLLDLGSGALGELHRHVDPLTVELPAAAPIDPSEREALRDLSDGLLAQMRSVLETSDGSLARVEGAALRPSAAERDRRAVD